MTNPPTRFSRRPSVVRSPAPIRCSATPPTRARSTDGKNKDELEDPEDPWRDPGAAAALGDPAVARTGAHGPDVAHGRLGVRDVLFGGRVSYLALSVLAVLALLIGLVGGVVGRKTAEVVEAFTTSKVNLSTNGNSESPGRPVRQSGCRGG